MAIQTFGDKATLNFPDHCYAVEFLVPPGIRITTKVKEEEPHKEK
jgi:hypothetical protein